MGSEEQGGDRPTGPIEKREERVEAPLLSWGRKKRRGEEEKERYRQTHKPFQKRGRR